jgi:uncharacterized lipoprotein
MPEETQQTAAPKRKKVKAKQPTIESVLGADNVLSSHDKLRAVPVATHEWQPNSRAFVCEMNSDERDQFETDWVEYRESLDDDDNNVGFRAFTVAWGLCDADRNRLFAGREAEAAQVIGARSGKTTARLFNTLSRINGLTKADIDALEKN